MVLEGPLYELMVKVDLKLYRKYVSINSKGTLILYMNMHKSLYELLRSALIFNEKLFYDLEVYVFVINPCGPCVDNTEINGYQMTVVCHVNDLKVSHKDSFEVTRLAAYLNDICGDLKANQGKVHDYLGMYLDYSEEGIMKKSMIKYLNNVFRELPENLGISALLSDAENIFKVIP